MTRKGARRMSEIPPAVLKALNEGREETRTLVEWLAIETDTLLGHVLKDIGLAREAARLRRAFAPRLRPVTTPRKVTASPASPSSPVAESRAKVLRIPA